MEVPVEYDVVVIGSGPGGYVCAIRCAQLGMKTALVERYATLGGTCLNVGCIPSKALLDSTEFFHQATKNFNTHGIEIDGIRPNIQKMFDRKDSVVSQTCDGIKFLMKKNKIEVLHGHASFLNANTIAVQQGDTRIELKTKKAVIATGSKPSSLPGIAIDKQRIITSTEALSLRTIPEKMLVIGGGVIGLELGSVYSRLGTKVSVVEFMDRIIPGMDSTLSKELQRVLKKQGMEFFLEHAVQQAVSDGNQVTVTAKNKKGDLVDFSADYCLVAVGRKPYTQQLGLENAGIQLSERGFITVTSHLETSVPGIYAIGDVIGGMMLAHKAEEEGVLVAEVMAGQKPHINYRAIPGVVYTWPEVAGVGYTEDELKKEGRACKTGSFPFRALGRARAANEIEGLVKVVTDAQTDEILGIHMLGARVADLIAEAVVALEFRASAEDLARMSHAHPTFAEAIKEAALDATGKRAIHM
ncbi:MAG: dihydrolipoyl dehydrogenase [SAR324 cluster bacterium]|nr:dihydrolipoyl dehydrogenase [SAR324 cluster bacterium]